jgi:hypothetical protein
MLFPHKLLVISVYLAAVSKCMLRESYRTIMMSMIVRGPRDYAIHPKTIDIVSPFKKYLFSRCQNKVLSDFRCLGDLVDLILIFGWWNKNNSLLGKQKWSLVADKE